MKIKNILIIHNSTSDRELLSEFIVSGIGAVDVVKVASEFKALQLLKERQFDVIFSSMILNRFEELPLQNTQIIALISEANERKIKELTSHGIQQYLTFPINQQAVQNKLNSILRDGISRKYPRYNVPGTRVSLQHGLTEIDGDVLRISEGGILCKFSVEGSWGHLTKDTRLTLKFPKQYGGSTLTDLDCKYLITRGIEKKGKKTLLQIVFLLPILQEKPRSILSKALVKADRIQNPVLKWRENRLEVKLFKHKYLFYKIHLFRLSVLALILVAVISALFLNRDLIFGPSDPLKQMQIVWHDGQLLTKTDQQQSWQPTDKQILPQDNLIKISQHPFSSIAALGTPTSEPVNAHAVIRFSPEETVHITKGGSVKRSESDKRISYHLTGAVHLFFQVGPSKAPNELQINGIEFTTDQSHIYFQDLSYPATVNVIEGSLEIHPNQPLFLSIDSKISPKEGRLHINQKHQIHLSKEIVRVSNRNNSHLEYFDNTYLPGFKTKGRFKHIGYALADKTPFTLQRHSNSYKVKARLIPVMVNDILTTSERSQVRLNLLDGNRIKLYEKGTLDISGYQIQSLVEKPASEKVDTADSDPFDSEASRLSFQGRLRVNLSSEKKNKEIRFQSVNASIHPKAAVFETFAHPQKTEVLVLSNQVNISDLNGNNSMMIPQGMMSSLEKNSPPHQPEPIPRKKILNLLDDSLDADRQLKPSSLNLENLNQMALKPDASIPFYWNTGLASAKIILGEKSYPLYQKKGSVEMVLKYQAFKGAKTGRQTATLKVTDLKGRNGTHRISLLLLPQLEKKTIPGKIRFQKGQSILAPESFLRLDTIANTILKDKRVRRLSVEGHSDSDGLEFINLRLSQKRADAVKQYLTDKGVPESIITSKGFGSRIPISRNMKAGEKAENRRVEIVLTRDSALIK